MIAKENIKNLLLLKRLADGDAFKSNINLSRPIKVDAYIISHFRKRCPLWTLTKRRGYYVVSSNRRFSRRPINAFRNIHISSFISEIISNFASHEIFINSRRIAELEVLPPELRQELFLVINEFLVNLDNMRHMPNNRTYDMIRSCPYILDGNYTIRTSEDIDRTTILDLLATDFYPLLIKLEDTFYDTSGHA